MLIRRLTTYSDMAPNTIYVRATAANIPSTAGLTADSTGVKVYTRSVSYTHLTLPTN